MDSNVVNFKVRPIPLEISPDGGFSAYLEGRPTYDFDRVLDEVIKRYRNVEKKQLRTHAEYLFETAADVVEEDLVNVQFGNYMLLRPFMHAKLKDKKGKFDPSKHKVNLHAMCRKELQVDFSKFTFHNNTDGKILKVTSVNSVGADDDTSVTIGLDIEINGDNTNLLAERTDLDPKDRVEFSCEKTDGTVVTGEAEVRSSSIHRITCAWPEALDASAAGGEVTFTVYGRCGEDDAGQQCDSTRAVTILAGEEPEPEPVPPTPTGPTVTAINDGTFHDGSNVVTGADMRFSDAYPATHVTIKTAAGEPVSAMIGDDGSVEPGPERFALSISVDEEMTPGAEYVFEFAMIDADGEPVTVSHSARWRAE